MKLTTVASPSDLSKHFVFDVSLKDQLDAKNVDLVWREVIDKASDKILEEIYPDLVANFRKELPKFITEFGNEIVVQGIKRLAEIKSTK